ncbi:beta-galactosidase [Anaerotaenia torta]
MKTMRKDMVINMEKSILFPQTGGFVHGCDYNPEQWLDRPDILAEDIRMMKKAGVNSVTLGMFSWSFLEPVEGEFQFGWLREIIDRLYENGIYTILGTPSGARPAWLDAAYPEAMRVSKQDVRNHHGVRHNHCMSSLRYREKVAILDRRLAEEFGSHPGLLMYHISNELGGDCYCPLCVERFQSYLAEKFDHDIEKLNQAWWTAFWSHRYNNFQQIEPPFANGEGSIMGLNLEWKRFTTWNMTDFMKFEIAALREVTPDIPVTTNFMMLYNGLDYRKMAEEVDVISWDSYPRFHNDRESLYDTMAEYAFHHAVMRSMKKEKPFMLMESAPGLVNWHPYNKLKRPGVHRLACLQAIACGSDTVQYFQWRKGRGSFEQYHGAVVDHLGTDDTRVFLEVAEVGELLSRISAAAGTLVKSKAALLFDWDNRWAIQDVKALSDETKRYEETCIGIWKEFLKLGVEMDVIPSDGDFSEYSVIVAPMLYVLQPRTAARLKSFTEQGGQLLATYFTGYVDQNLLCHLGGFPGDGLSELFGIVSEEIDTLYPSDRNQIHFTEDWVKEVSAEAGTASAAEEQWNWEVKDYAEILRVKDARVLACYKEDFYKGTAAVTCKTYERSEPAGSDMPVKQGRAYYVAARSCPRQMSVLFAKMLEDAGIEIKKLPQGIEYHSRTGEEGSYEFYLNCRTEAVTLEGLNGADLITGNAVEGSLELGAYSVAVLRK